MPSLLPRADRVLRSRALRLTTGLLAVAAVVAACGDADGTITAATGSSAPVSQVIVQPKVDTIFARDSVRTTDLIQLTATVIGFSGTKLSGATVRWSTPDTGIVTVDSLGIVRPKRLGTATIIAKSGNKEDQATVVVAPAATRIAITSTTRTANGLPVTVDTIFVTDSIRPTDRRQLRAVAIGPRGDTLSGFRYAWRSSNTSVATVDTAGLVLARGIGTTTITAEAAGLPPATWTVVVSSNLKRVDVTARTNRVLVGDTLRLTAVGIGFDGRPVPGVRFRYATSNGAIAQVDTNGVVRFLSPGSVILSAIGNFVTGTFAASVQVFTYTYQSIASGTDYSCAITQLGFIDCWGRTAEGQTAAAIADTVCSNIPTPASIGCVLLPKRGVATEGYVSVAAGESTTCALDGQGRAYCWGTSNFKFGNGQNSGGSTPKLVTSALTFARQPATALNQSNYTTYSGTISVGGSHACAITDGSFLAYCWGSDAVSQLGNADTLVASSTPIPVDTTAAGLRFAFISAGYLHTCAITAAASSGAPAGRVYCWGSNAAGELGLGSTTAAQRSPQAISSTLTFANVSTGLAASPNAAGAQTCGVTTGGAVYCWGANTSGQAGAPASTAPITTPNQVSGSGFRSVSAGGDFTCGLRVDGQIDCWGSNVYGQLGIGSFASSSSPARVAAPIMVGSNNTSVALSGISYSALSVGRRHACALATDGWVYCWGSDVLGALGDQFQALTQNRPIRVYHAGP